MSAAIARLTDVPAGILAGCDRLVHPAVTSQAERERQRRFIGVMLATPFAAGTILALAPFAAFGIAALLAILCAIFAFSWSLALAVSLSGRGEIAERAALGFAVVGIAAAASISGPSSPILLLAAAVGFETYWIGRSARAAATGIAAALASVAVCAVAGNWLAPAGAAAAASAWQWLLPVLYAAMSWPRVREVFSESSAKESHAQEMSLADLLDLTVLKLSPFGEIIEASRGTAGLFGLAPELLVGSTFFERVHVGDRVAFMTALAELRQAAGPGKLEVRLRVAEDGRGGGSYRPFAIELAQASEPDHLVLLVRDISEVAGLREEATHAQAAADSIDLAKSRFLAAVSHELRTPLNSIIGFSDMLLHGIAGEIGDGRQRDYVGLIRQSGMHLLSVVNAILDVSKIESGAYSIRVEPFVVKEAVQLCHSMVAQQAQAKGLTLTTRMTPDPGEITADRRAVQQIVLNLVTNAIKFTPAGGNVTVETQRSGQWLRLVVSDTGIGIAEEDLSRIGQPFMQVRNDFTRQFDGAGLGLSLVKGLVKLHEGEMTIESAPGEGTVVTVSLPVAGPRNTDGETIMRSDEKPVTLHRIGIGGSDATIRKTA